MRCTRCDGLAVPQALGHTPDGRFVFGWCLTCLEETGCVEVAVAQPARKHRPHAAGPARPRPLTVGAPAPPSDRPGGASTPPDRRRLLSALALVLSAWGFILLLGGLLVRPRSAALPPSPLGNGTPPLLVVGGGSTAAVGLALWVVTSGGVLASRPGLKAVQLLAFLAAVSMLAAGIAVHSPRRDPLVVALASIAVGISLAARWVEVRRFRPSPTCRRD